MISACGVVAAALATFGARALFTLIVINEAVGFSRLLRDPIVPRSRTHIHTRAHTQAHTLWRTLNFRIIFAPCCAQFDASTRGARPSTVHQLQRCPHIPHSHIVDELVTEYIKSHRLSATKQFARFLGADQIADNYPDRANADVGDGGRVDPLWFGLGAGISE